MATLRAVFLSNLLVCIILLQDVPETAGTPLRKNIVNGTIVQSGQYPFMVSIQVDKEHWCAGSIITPLHILTAAHCLEDYSDPKRYSIVVGTVKLSEGGYRYNVSSIRMHGHYNDDLAHDIGIVTLGEPLCFDKFVKPISLPAQNTSTPSSSRVNVIGWGHQKSGGRSVDELMKVELIVYSDEVCQAIHEDSPLMDIPLDTNICAGVPEGRRAECNADSGGPVFTKEHQVGIVSWSVKPCGLFPYPGIYTEVSHYTNWIKKYSKFKGVNKMRKVCS